MSNDYCCATSQQMMTLSAIAYVLDGSREKGKKIEHIKAAIIDQLKCANYATQDKWELVWGPVMDDNPARGKDTDNLWFIVKHKERNAYAVVLRGTSPQWRSWWQDIPLRQVHFNLIDRQKHPKIKVSNQFESDAKVIISQKDGGKNIIEFLEQSAESKDMMVYVTGHSQGGGLAPMVQARILLESKKWKNGDSINIQGYTFAGPTSGNKEFADYVDSNLKLFRVFNKRDIVPYGYGSLEKIIKNRIPKKPPFWVRMIICAARLYLKWIGPWKQPAANPIPLCCKSDPEGGTWLNQVEHQHDHNTYLRLLGANKVKLSLS